MTLSKRIRKIREAKNLTQLDAAFKFGITPLANGQTQRNASKSTYDTVLKIANALDVSILFLLDTNNTDYTEN